MLSTETVYSLYFLKQKEIFLIGFRAFSNTADYEATYVHVHCQLFCSYIKEMGGKFALSV